MLTKNSSPGGQGATNAISGRILITSRCSHSNIAAVFHSASFHNSRGSASRPHEIPMMHNRRAPCSIDTMMLFTPIAVGKHTQARNVRGRDGLAFIRTNGPLRLPYVRMKEICDAVLIHVAYIDDLYHRIVSARAAIVTVKEWKTESPDWNASSRTFQSQHLE